MISNVLFWHVLLYDIKCIVLSWGGSAPPTPQLVGLRPPRTVGQAVGRTDGRTDSRTDGRTVRDQKNDCIFEI
jgi:hypothetical protein